MRLARRACVAMALAVVVVAIGCTLDTASAMVCDNGDNGGIGPITGHVDANLTVHSNAECTFGPTGSLAGDIEVEGRVNGNIIVNGGEVYVRGSVNGNIEASSNHDITLDGGTIEGNIMMEAEGDVTIKSGSVVMGNIEMEGDGDVTVKSDSVVTGNIEKYGTGGVTLAVNSTVKGNVKCSGSGTNLINGTVDGDIEDC